MNIWTKPNDQLPADGSRVLVYIHRLNEIQISEYSNGRFWQGDDVTYWLDLPNPPYNSRIAAKG